MDIRNRTALALASNDSQRFAGASGSNYFKTTLRRLEKIQFLSL